MKLTNYEEAAVFAHALIEVESLMYYDGPVVSHCRDGVQDYVVSWTDIDDVYTYWLAIQVSKADLAMYIEKKITLLQVEERSAAIFACRGAFLDDGEARGLPIDFADIQEDWLPTADSFL